MNRGSGDIEGAIRAAHARGDANEVIRLAADAYSKVIFSFALRIVKDKRLAEDVAQETFVQALRDVRRWDERASFRAWLFSIARHRCLDAVKMRGRRQKRFVRDEGADAPEDAAGPDDDLAEKRLLRALEECLGELSEQSRMTVLLYYQEERSYEGLSLILGESAEALRARVSRARPTLRKCLQRKGVTL